MEKYMMTQGVQFDDSENGFAVLQLNRDADDKLFRPLRDGEKPVLEDYHVVASAYLKRTAVKNIPALLEDLFYVFNRCGDTPYEFEGHSMSVSDMIYLSLEGKKSLFYVQPVGFDRVTV